ncbi:sulfurtransferase [Candidatus Thorarchaeota archaeon]|nr:MAG: sulfurtransferase [Candidatus Thorarchaeota archaeon]
MKSDETPYGFGDLKWVSTNWLEERLDEIRVIDIQPDIHDYIKAHIPGAVYFAQKLLRVPEHGRPGVYIEPEQFEALMSRIGVNNDTPVVIYTGIGLHSGIGDGLDQPMLAYTLMRFGHKEVYLLDGGFDKWVREGKLVTQEFPEIKPTKFKAKVNKGMYVDLQQVEKMKDKDDVVLLDARPGNWYKGEDSPWIRDGHIPGAVNLPWKTLMHPENAAELKPVEEIRKLAEEVGATKDKTIICSCGTGREATNEYTIFKHLLDYPDVKLYEGSFTEWTMDPDRPVATGTKP